MTSKEAWLRLFPTLLIIRCFLHAFLRIHERCRSNPLFPRVRHLVWRIYHARSQRNYYYHFDKFLTFARQHLTEEAFKAVERFKRKRDELRQGLLHPGCHRVSTMLERHMQLMTCCLYMARDFHGHRDSVHLLVRSWALLPTRSVAIRFTFHVTVSQAEWPVLPNLLVASSNQVEYFHQIR